MDSLSIGQVAQRAGVGVETVRFYEREGLLEEPPRRASGYRQYSEQVVTASTTSVCHRRNLAQESFVLSFHELSSHLRKSFGSLLLQEIHPALLPQAHTLTPLDPVVW